MLLKNNNFKKALKERNMESLNACELEGEFNAKNILKTMEDRKEFVYFYNIPIYVHDEDLFFYQLDAYNEIYSINDKLIEFKEFINNRSHDEYIEEYKEFVSKVTDFLRGHPDFNDVKSNLEENPNKLKYELSKKDVYQVNNVNKEFISLDLAANSFNSLAFWHLWFFTKDRQSFYDYNGVLSSQDYPLNFNQFAGFFTDKPFLKNNKEIRNLILGKTFKGLIRNIKYYILNDLIATILGETDIELKDIVLLNGDEIIIEYNKNFEEELYNVIEKFYVPVKLQAFKLYGVADKNRGNKVIGYVKEVMREKGIIAMDRSSMQENIYIDNNKSFIEIKKYERFYIPFIWSLFNNYEINELDLYSYNKNQEVIKKESPDIYII